MLRAAFICLVLSVPAARAEPATVADLVRQLGHNRFAVREAAEAELLRRGETIVPDLDRAVVGVDAETAERVRKIRTALVGYRDDIKRFLDEMDRRSPFLPDEPIAQGLRDLVAGHQPGAGDLLLDFATDPKHPRRIPARKVFLETYQSATPAQVDRYIRDHVYLLATHRPKFPARAGGMIAMEAIIVGGWGEWFSLAANKRLPIASRTTRYVDGKPYEQPYQQREPFGTVGWYRTGELALGKHTIHAVLEYEFTHNGEKRKGSVRSPDSTFEVVAADTPDDLIAPNTDELTRQVRTAFRLQETEQPAAERRLQIGALTDAEYWQPQVEWFADGKRSGVHGPVWKVTGPLDADLCFEVAIHDVATGKVYPADPLVFPRRTARTGMGVPLGYITPRDVVGFAAGRDGFVTVKIVLTPSRGLALTDTRITRYYAEPIATGELRMKVFADLNARPKP
jgi:hypothetical protein